MTSTCDISLKTWLDENEACIYTTLCRQDLYDARMNGKIPFRRYGPRRIIYKRVDLDKLIEKHSEYMKSFDELILKNKK